MAATLTALQKALKEEGGTMLVSFEKGMFVATLVDDTIARHELYITYEAGNVTLLGSLGELDEDLQE